MPPREKNMQHFINYYNRNCKEARTLLRATANYNKLDQLQRSKGLTHVCSGELRHDDSVDHAGISDCDCRMGRLKILVRH